MRNKILTIVCMAVVIALSTGAVAFFSTGCDSEADSTVTPTAGDMTDAPSADPVTEGQSEEVTESIPSETDTEAPTDPDDPDDADDPDIYGYTAVLVSSDAYRIRRVYDHTVGSEVTAREVFGKLYSYCSLSFSDDGTFELCINPNSGETRTGVYTVYGDEIAVEYDDGRGSEFRIVADTPGEIDYIIVNYGNYDVYFGR